MPPPPTASFGRRHLLDIAMAHAALGEGPEATAILTRLHRLSPEWLRHQKMATEVFRHIQRHRRHRMTKDQATLGHFLGAV
ncbi:hypothetical protein K4G22_27110 [Streptomyces profundus]|nr:hypothetical protein K4G22_27110 [Streptomyces sp. MA3_2.13]